MAINKLNNSNIYQDTARQSQNAENRSSASSKSLSPVTVTPTSVTQTVTAVFKDGDQESNLSDDQSRYGEATASQIRAAISGANYKATRTRCEFSINEPTKRISIKVIDKQTEEVIREIPPEESLEMLAKIWELAGLLVDEKR